MKVFVSWSGKLSQLVAEILHKYLPVMLQDVEAFMSKHDLQSGARWSSELTAELEASSFGVLCLAPENLNSPWLLFEAGALTKHVEGRACGLLLGTLKPTDVTGPLSQFQHRAFSKEGLAALLRDINTKLPKGLDASQVALVFEKWWPDLDRDYQAALNSAVGESQVVHRDQRDIVEEILGRVRTIERAVEESRVISEARVLKAVLDIGSDDPTTSLGAARELLEIRDPRTIPRLVQIMWDEILPTPTKLTVMAALKHFGEAAVPSLIDKLREHARMVSEQDGALGDSPQQEAWRAAVLESDAGRVLVRIGAASIPSLQELRKNEGWLGEAADALLTAIKKRQ